MEAPNLELQREFFGLRMQQLRYEKNLKLRTLQIYTRLTYGFLYRIEHGKQSPSLDSMTKIFKVLGVTFDGFFHTKNFQQGKKY